MSRQPTPQPPRPRQCGDCHGTGGHTTITTRNGHRTETWRRCGPCRGTGVRGGGI